MSNGNGPSDHAWDFIKNFPGSENCPRCDSVPECYSECSKKAMEEIDRPIATWSDCKDACIAKGGDFAFEYDTWESDRGCAMHLSEENRCICVKGTKTACKNIAAGQENCPNCGDTLYGGMYGGAPECLATCDWDHQREFLDIASWEDCQNKCKSQGDPFTYQFNKKPNPLLGESLNKYDNRGCAIYAPYDNMMNQGKCVCVEGRNFACDGVVSGDVPPALLPVTETISYEMIEGYGIGVISTLIILLMGLMMACLCRRYKSVSKQYAKVNFVDSEDEQIVINS